MSERRGAIGESPTVRVCRSATNQPSELLESAREIAESTHVVEVGPLGFPRFDPLVIVTSDGQSAFHPNTSRSDVEALVDSDGVHAGTSTRAVVQVRLQKGFHVNSNEPLEPYLIPT
ncbi:MAG: hypothetical protein IH933_10455, partial [Euryarchaeota archaeon]|nr:hypothetical protein [Euryarchaeota archaeon]